MPEEPRFHERERKTDKKTQKRIEIVVRTVPDYNLQNTYQTVEHLDPYWIKNLDKENTKIY